MVILLKLLYSFHSRHLICSYLLHFRPRFIWNFPGPKPGDAFYYLVNELSVRSKALDLDHGQKRESVMLHLPATSPLSLVHNGEKALQEGEATNALPGESDDLMKEIEKLMEQKIRVEADQKAGSSKTNQLDKKIDGLFTKMLKNEASVKEGANVGESVEIADSEAEGHLDEEISNLFKDLEMLDDDSNESETL